MHGVHLWATLPRLLAHPCAGLFAMVSAQGAPKAVRVGCVRKFVVQYITITICVHQVFMTRCWGAVWVSMGVFDGSWSG